jgi:hypothetical protein
MLFHLPKSDGGLILKKIYQPVNYLEENYSYKTGLYGSLIMATFQ